MWYVHNSFTEYNISNTPQQSVIEKIPEEPLLPVRERRHIFARIFRYFFSFHTNLVFRIRVSSNISNAIFFRSSSSTERSFSELGVRSIITLMSSSAVQTPGFSPPGPTKKTSGRHQKYSGPGGNLKVQQICENSKFDEICYISK